MIIMGHMKYITAKEKYIVKFCDRNSDWNYEQFQHD